MKKPRDKIDALDVILYVARLEKQPVKSVVIRLVQAWQLLGLTPDEMRKAGGRLDVVDGDGFFYKAREVVPPWNVRSVP